MTETDCGCKTLYGHYESIREGIADDEIRYCPLHKAAGKLLEACKTLLADAKKNIEDFGGCDHGVGICCCGEIRNCEIAAEAVREAEGK